MNKPIECNFKDDEIIVVATDTVYGLAISVKNRENFKKLNEIKQREIDQPVIILVGSNEQARNFNEWNQKSELAALKFWPGNVSLIVNKQGFRMPKSKPLCELLLDCGPMFATSANLHDQPILESISEIKNVFPLIEKHFDFDKPNGKASLIIDLDNDLVLRD